ncbi:VCBS repeat-containing protein, partial [bacterium]|nr:VCBS repeat-containing protein [bacterium]
IYAGGEFTRAAGYDGLFNYIARWNGSEWQKLSDGLDAPVYALGVKGTDVFIGGKFKTNPGIKFIPVGPVGPVINGFAFADQFHFIRWRNPVPDVPFNRNISPPFDGYADYGYGVSWRDFDTDGDEDIIISAMNSTVILKNSGEKAFERVPESPVRSWPELNSWADFDNDGDDDVINAGFRGPSSYTKTFSINKGNGLFEKSDAFNFSPTWWVWSGAWGDLDNDGYADFILQNFDPTNVRNMQILMYRNIRADHFSCEEVDASRDFFFENGHISWSDMDDDGDIDLLYTPSQWFLIPWNLDSYQQVYLNSGGQFIKAEAGDLTQESMQSSMAAWGDYDNDGDFDVFISVLDGHNALFQNQGDGSFIRMTDAPMCQDGGSSTFASWCDFDIDGDLDLFVMNRKHGDNFMYENLGNGTFLTVLDNQFTNLEQDSELGAWYDYDRDGDQDLFMVSEMNTPFYMMENTQSTENHWLNLKLTGIKSNRNALGAKVHVKSMINGDLVIQTREVNGQAAWSQSSLEQVIGLGDAQLAHIIIEWPSGIMQVLIDADADQFLCIEEDTALDGLEKPAGLSARTILELGLEGELAQASKPAVPESYDLSSCYPNPFNPSTEISYALPRESVVTIRVINALGQEVRMLLSEKQDAGTYRVRWDGLDLRGNAVPSGLYLCRMESDGFVQTQKMMLVR